MTGYLLDIVAFLGVILISIGFFTINLTAGLIATGLLLIGVAYLMSRGGD